MKIKMSFNQLSILSSLYPNMTVKDFITSVKEGVIYEL